MEAVDPLSLPTAGASVPPGLAARLGVVPALSIVWHHDPSRIGEVALLRDLLLGRPVEISRAHPTFAPLHDPGAARPLTDPHLSRSPALLVAPGPPLRLDPTGQAVDLGGAGRTVGERELADGVVITLAGRVVLCLHQLALPVARGDERFDMIGETDAIEAVRRQVRAAAQSGMSVLIRGETGTGKELVARALGRPGRPFVAVNMGAIATGTAVAELFGHARGAFTGATGERPGHFGLADGGTLFLDEVGLTPIEVQPMLLRALESGEVQPVGARAGRKVDVRVVAATDAASDVLMAADRFLPSLRQRLTGYVIVTPPLRARRADVGPLLLHLLRRELPSGHLATDTSWFPAPLAAELARQPWPGNVRELHNVVRRIAADSATLPRAGFNLHLHAPPAGPPPSRQRTDGDLREALERNGWKWDLAARELALPRTTLRRLAEERGLARIAAQIPAGEIEAALASCAGDRALTARQLGVSRRALTLRLAALRGRAP